MCVSSLRRSQASRLHFAIEPVVGVLPMDLNQPLLKPILFLSPVVVGRWVGRDGHKWG